MTEKFASVAAATILETSSGVPGRTTTETWSSAVRYVLRGAVFVLRLPVRFGFTPSWS